MKLKDSHLPPAIILVTGTTGFLGKVVLEELIRRQHELNVKKVFLILRSKRGKSAFERFESDVVTSECFRLHKKNWKDFIQVINGDLTEDHLGTSPEDYAELSKNVTHIIHCAASVDFNLPILSATKSNIDSALSVLEFAKTCPHLKRMVDVSTAYVHPHHPEEIGQVLTRLPVAAEKFYQDIKEERINQSEALAVLGHPNTYTLTKCLAEHLLTERRGKVPLSIVRPSIISVATQYPFPGWIDSFAALAGFIAGTAIGHVRVISGDRNTRLDVVPVDRVSHIIVDQTFYPNLNAEVPIIHAVAGLKNALPVSLIEHTVLDYFRRHPQEKTIKFKKISPYNRRLELEHQLYHRGPLYLAKIAAKLSGKKHLSKRMDNIDRKLEALFRIFPYFTHNTFNFKLSDENYHLDPEKYLELISEGIHRNLLKKNPQRRIIAGEKYKPSQSRPVPGKHPRKANETIRATGIILDQSFKKIFSEISYDPVSFEQALKHCQPDHHLVIASTHRSYTDFLLCSYLFFKRPELKIEIPYIAAAEEFSKIPALGKIFKRMNAFYIQRGAGQEDPVVSLKIQKLVEEKKPIQFFIEGQRSRSRHFLTPKRGLLRALQATGKQFYILPISISYDRVPEEESLLGQMKGLPKEKMGLKNLLSWIKKMSKSKTQLGMVHIRCGAPLTLNPESEIRDLSLNLMNELQQNMVVSSYHLQCFLRAHPSLDLSYDLLKFFLEGRGAVVLESDLQHEQLCELDSTLERSFRMQWIHFFMQDALDHCPGNQALINYAKQTNYLKAPTTPLHHDAELSELLKTLFHPVKNDYHFIALATIQVFQNHSQSSEQKILELSTFLDRPTALLAIQALKDGEFISTNDSGEIITGPKFNQLQNFAQSCLL